MSIKLMTYLKVASILFLTGCSTFKIDSYPITPFPPRHETIEYTATPVLEYVKTNKTYIVSTEFMRNAIANQIFVEEILKWKRDNGIR